MSFFDLDAVNDAPDTGGAIPPGIYLVEVANAEVKTSQAGNEYVSLRLAVVNENGSAGRTAAYDNLIFTGNPGALGMTKKKLACLGVEAKGKADQQAFIDMLLGRRVYIQTKLKENGWSEVDINAKGAKCGYWPENEGPDRPVSRAPAGTVDDKAPWDE